MQFDKYNPRELRLAGAELVEIVRQYWLDKRITTQEWTELVLDYFAFRARPDLLVEAEKPQRDPRAPKTWRPELPVRTTRGEFGSFDMLHSSNPVGDHGQDDYWTELIASPFEVFLALESEWGKAGSPAVTRRAVLSDATKLALIRARTKVMVLGPVDSAQAEELFDELARLRTSSADPAPWLLVSVPWKVNAPTWKVLSGRRRSRR